MAVGLEEKELLELLFLEGQEAGLVDTLERLFLLLSLKLHVL
jgi:hypothetical protein